MSYECFETLMTTLEKYWKHMCALEEQLGVQFEDNWMTNHFDDIVDAITTEFEGPGYDDIDEKIGPVVMYWMFDMNYGKEKTILHHKGINYEVKHLEDLYMVLKSIKDYREAGL